MVTKSQRFAKSTWFLGKESHKTKCCYVKNIVTCLWMFWKEFDGEKNLRIWPLKYGTFFRLSSSETQLLATTSVLHLFWRWRPVVRASHQPRNAAVLKHKAQSTKNFRLDLISLLFSQELIISSHSVAQYNSLKRLCWICLVALRWKHYNLNI